MEFLSLQSPQMHDGSKVAVAVQKLGRGKHAHTHKEGDELGAVGLWH